MKIPEYKQQVSLDVPNLFTPNMPSAPEEAFGGGQFKALERIGEVGANIADSLRKRAIEKRRLQQEAESQNIINQFKIDMQDVLYSQDQEEVENAGQKTLRVKGLLNQQLASANGATSRLQQKYSELKEKYVTAYGADNEKLMQQLDDEFVSARQRVISHEAKQSNDYIVNSLNDGLQVIKNEASEKLSPLEIEKNVFSAEQLSEAIQNANGVYDKDSISLAKETATYDVVSNAAAGLFRATGDMVAAEGIVDKYAKKIGPENVEKIKTSLSVGFEAKQNREKKLAAAELISKRYDFLDKVAKGDIDWNNYQQEVRSIAPHDKLLAEVITQIVSSGGKYISPDNLFDNKALADTTKLMLSSTDAQGASQYLLNQLKDKGGNISKDTLGVLVSVSKEISDSLHSDTVKDSENISIMKMAQSFYEKFNSISSIKAMASFLRNKQKNSLSGEELKKSIKDIAVKEVIRQYPQIINTNKIPNKIVDDDGNIQQIHNINMEFNYGEDGVATDER